MTRYLIIITLLVSMFLMPSTTHAYQDATIAGFVGVDSNCDGHAVPKVDALMIITDKDGNTQTVFTNEDGLYIYQFARVGQTYTIEHFHNNYHFITAFVAVEGNNIHNLIIKHCYYFPLILV